MKKYTPINASNNGWTKQKETSTWQLEVLEPRLLLSADILPGIHELEGVIEQPGERDVYEFVLDKQSRFLFDMVLKGLKLIGIWMDQLVRINLIHVL